MTTKKSPIAIKKYANRRLYHTGTSTYVTLDDLAGMVKRGEEFVVSDAKTGEDITRSVLGQIIFEQEGKSGQNLLPVTYVTGDMTGKLDSPLYGMFGIIGALDGLTINGVKPVQRFIGPPEDPSELAIKWDGEWQITYETFRDMGAAYAVGLVLIYLLVVAQFGSYFVPLIIMAPIPLTIIGVMPGHAMLGAQFTATSMIGMIALAGIIVRNSILLVDFVNLQVAGGMPLDDAVIDAAATRAKRSEEHTSELQSH